MKQIQLTLALIVSVVFCQSADATLIRVSQIVNFATGRVGDSGVGTDSANGWQFPQNELTVTNGSGSLSGTALGLVASAGDKIETSSISNLNNFGCRNLFVTNNAQFPNANDTNLYYSFLYRFNSAADVSADGEKINVVNRANSGINSGIITGIHWELHARNAGGQIQLGVYKFSGTATNYATTNIAEGQTVFVVIRQHIIPGATNDVVDLWINPPIASFGAAEGSVPPSSVSTFDGSEDQSATTGPGRFWVGAGANTYFDELRIATTWAEVTPPLGQCDAATVTDEPDTQSMVAGINATFRVAANGTSPTYLWQIRSNGAASFVDIPGATASTYSTPNLQLADSGNQYRAIVNVECNNSSTTSQVASVTVTNPAITPLGLVMHDDFIDPLLGGFNSRNNPPLTISNSLWYTAGTLSSLLTADSGGNMVGETDAAGSSLWLGYFTETNALPVHLAIGRAIKVTMPFVPGGTIGTNAGRALRFGLFDYADGSTRVLEDGAVAGGSAGNGTGVRGYMLNLAFASTLQVEDPLEIMARNTLDDINLIGTTADYIQLGTGPEGLVTNTTAFQDGVTNLLEFTVARTDVNTVVVTISITGGGLNWSSSVTDTNYAYHRFDAFAIRPNNRPTTADRFTFPEFRVEVIEAVVPVVPFRITEVMTLSPDGVRLAWESINGVNYQVQSRDSLSSGNWTTNATVSATGSLTAYTNSPIAGSVTERYYRVVAQ